MHCHPCRSSHSHWTLSPIQVPRLPVDLRRSCTCAHCQPSSPNLNPPATRRRRIRIRASTNLRGRAASRTALVQAPARSLRSLCEPTVHQASLARAALRSAARSAALCRAPPTQLPAAARTVQPRSPPSEVRRPPSAVRGPSSVARRPSKTPTPRDSPI
jgi:hypothetical protein